MLLYFCDIGESSRKWKEGTELCTVGQSAAGTPEFFLPELL